MFPSFQTLQIQITATNTHSSAKMTTVLLYAITIILWLGNKSMSGGAEFDS